MTTEIGFYKVLNLVAGLDTVEIVNGEQWTITETGRYMLMRDDAGQPELYKLKANEQGQTVVDFEVDRDD